METSQIFHTILFVVLAGLFFLFLGVLISALFFVNFQGNELYIAGSVLVGGLLGAIVGVGISLTLSFYLKEETLFKLSLISLIGSLLTISILKLLSTNFT